MMRLGFIFLTAIIMAGITGCSALGIVPKTDMTIEQQITVIGSTARTATFVALTETSDNDTELSEKATELKASIETDILPLLYDGSVTFNEVTIGLLEQKIDRRYMVYLSQAFVLLELYYEVPDVGDIMTSDDISLWVAFLEGILQGADDALITIDN